jgi:RNA polymerase sigma factor (TIGR02999 family)
MDPPVAGEVTRLLRSVGDGDADALARVFPLLYHHLRRLADAQLRREAQGHTLTPTDLVHEAYLKLAPGQSLDARDRAHFLAIAARAMRQVLVDHARARAAHKREGGWIRATLHDELMGAPGDETHELLALDEALESLEPRQRTVVECRVFGGMVEADIAMALGLSERTVRRDWVKARAWLLLYMSGEGTAGPEEAGSHAAPP